MLNALFPLYNHLYSSWSNISWCNLITSVISSPFLSELWLWCHPLLHSILYREVILQLFLLVSSRMWHLGHGLSTESDKLLYGGGCISLWVGQSSWTLRNPQETTVHWCTSAATRTDFFLLCSPTAPFPSGIARWALVPLSIPLTIWMSCSRETSCWILQCTLFYLLHPSYKLILPSLHIKVSLNKDPLFALSHDLPRLWSALGMMNVKSSQFYLNFKALPFWWEYQTVLFICCQKWSNGANLVQAAPFEITLNDSFLETFSCHEVVSVWCWCAYLTSQSEWVIVDGRVISPCDIIHQLRFPSPVALSAVQSIFLSNKFQMQIVFSLYWFQIRFVLWFMGQVFSLWILLIGLLFIKTCSPILYCPSSCCATCFRSAKELLLLKCEDLVDDLPHLKGQWTPSPPWNNILLRQ